ncbi:hypothetical protein Tco_1390199 [Tanacetum coccineum]
MAEASSSKTVTVSIDSDEFKDLLQDSVKTLFADMDQKLLEAQAEIKELMKATIVYLSEAKCTLAKVETSHKKDGAELILAQEHQLYLQNKVLQDLIWNNNFKPKFLPEFNIMFLFALERVYAEERPFLHERMEAVKAFLTVSKTGSSSIHGTDIH